MTHPFLMALLALAAVSFARTRENLCDSNPCKNGATCFSYIHYRWYNGRLEMVVTKVVFLVYTKISQFFYDLEIHESLKAI